MCSAGNQPAAVATDALVGKPRTNACALPVLATGRCGHLHGTACLRHRHRPEALEEDLDLLPGAALEQVVVTRLRQDRHALRLVGGMKDSARLAERNDRIAAAMDDEE